MGGQAGCPRGFGLSMWWSALEGGTGLVGEVRSSVSGLLSARCPLNVEWRCQAGSEVHESGVQGQGPAGDKNSSTGAQQPFETRGLAKTPREWWEWVETGETHAVGRLGIYKAGRWAGAVGSWNHVKRGSQEVAATGRACCCHSGVRPENLGHNY